MKKIATLLTLMAVCTTLAAQERMYIHRSDKTTLGALVSATDSIYFTDNQTVANFRIGNTLAAYPTAELDSITFGPDSDVVTITYNGTAAAVVNPLAFEGVDVAVDGADVTVTSTSSLQTITYQLQGTTTNGMFKIYSNEDFHLLLNGVTITNNDGPAINIQSNQTTNVELAPGKQNHLTDGATYATAPNNEDQGAALFAEGDLVFTGTGAVTIHGVGAGKQGLGTDDHLKITNGTITIASAKKDGIHANDGVLISGGVVNVTSTGDGIDGDAGTVLISGGTVTTLNTADDVKGIKCDSTLTISGGIVSVTVTGNQSKGLKSDMEVALNGGTINLVNSGDAVLEASGSGYDPSYCTAIKCDANVVINGASITITTSGLAGKGISADGSIIMTSGSIQVTSTSNGSTYTNSTGTKDAYVSTCLSADVDIQILGGSVITSSSGSAGKGFSCDSELLVGTATTSPVIQITTTGSTIYISGSGNNASYAEAKAVKSDGDATIENGTITISSADDGIKSETAVTINGGVININNSVEGIEAPFITLNEGDVHITSTDDCINATFGNGGETNDGSLFKVTGGYLAVNTTGGDGLDSNGDILMTGGTVVVHGPPSAPEVGMDYNGSCNVNGGFMAISGPGSMMLQAPSTTSQQYSLKITTNQQLSATTLFHIQDASGNDVLTFQPKRAYSSIVFSSDDLVSGGSYSIYTGGSYSGGTNTDGLYTGGTYSGGTHKKTFTVTGKVTSVNF